MSKEGNVLPDNIITALQAANASVRETTTAIRAAYAEAEISDDYSDADELAADQREHLHYEFEYLLHAFAREYPHLFEQVTE